MQFSVAGEALEYFVIAGDEPKQVLERYTALTGRPASVPAWSYGLWLSTTFTTNYDEKTVNGFIDGMAERDLPLSVFHFDCFWMREFNWCDFEWDSRTFPDPEGMLARLHEKDLHVCVWINPYIAQRSPLFAEAKAAGYLLKRTNGDVWQWDLWQAGMGLVDFTNPDAAAWYQGKLRALLDQGVDAFKTDFGERIPLEVDYFDGSSPERMHNYYTQLYNQAVFDVLEEKRGAGDAVLFARSATAGGQSMPVHWGGDSTSTFESMAETLRGGLSLAFSGFGFWSHDIGGFEGTPDAGVFKRWTAFGLLSSHSRFHGSNSYRVPWAFDGWTARKTRVTERRRGDPQVHQAQALAHAVPLRGGPRGLAHGNAGPASDAAGVPGRPGNRLPRPPVHARRRPARRPGVQRGRHGRVLPARGHLDQLLHRRAGAGARAGAREKHGFDSLPLYVREGAVLPIGREERPARLRLPRRHHHRGLSLPGGCDAQHRRDDARRHDGGVPGGAQRRGCAGQFGLLRAVVRKDSGWRSGGFRERCGAAGAVSRAVSGAARGSAIAKYS